MSMPAFASMPARKGCQLAVLIVLCAILRGGATCAVGTGGVSCESRLVKLPGANGQLFTLRPNETIYFWASVPNNGSSRWQHRLSLFNANETIEQPFNSRLRMQPVEVCDNAPGCRPFEMLAKRDRMQDEVDFSRDENFWLGQRLLERGFWCAFGFTGAPFVVAHVCGVHERRAGYDPGNGAYRGCGCSAASHNRTFYW